MKSVIRKLYYCIQIFPLIENIINWPLIILAYIFPNHPYKLVLKNGTSFKINHHIDALTIKEIFLEEEYTSQNKNPKVIIDIGANIGTYSVLMSTEFPKAHIYSFEPDPRTFELLESNIRLNQCHNVEFFRLGVSGKSGYVNFYSSPITGTSSVIRSSNQGKVRSVRIKLITLEEIIKVNKIKHIDILKLDAEGIEFDILLNCQKSILSKISEIFFEYHDHLTTHRHQELVKKLRKFGYQITIRPHPFESSIGVIHAIKTN